METNLNCIIIKCSNFLLKIFCKHSSILVDGCTDVANKALECYTATVTATVNVKI